MSFDGKFTTDDVDLQQASVTRGQLIGALATTEGLDSAHDAQTPLIQLVLHQLRYECPRLLLLR